MKHSSISAHNSLFCIGLSHKKSNTIMRGKFSLPHDVISEIYQEASRATGIGEVFIISTCNRTEIYAFAPQPLQLITLLCNYTIGTIDEFQQHCYMHRNNDAINHLFRVGAGLDSQILGDSEIIGQIKKSFKFSKEHNLNNTFFERLINAVTQSSKRIKNKTSISSGATSVAFASVRYIINNVTNISGKNILLVGTGKLGENTCANLTKHIANNHITIINRSKEKSQKISRRFNVDLKNYNELKSEINKADILIVATGAEQPTISREMISESKALLILDLSIPKNVSDDVLDMPNISVCDVDYLSQITDDTIALRKKQIPLAEAIIDEVKNDFLTWVASRKYVPLIKSMKLRLEEIKLEQVKCHWKNDTKLNEEKIVVMSDIIIKQITSRFAIHLKDRNISNDKNSTLFSDFLQLEKVSYE